MSTFPQKKIDILGIGASTLDRFVVIIIQQVVRCSKFYPRPTMVVDL